MKDMPQTPQVSVVMSVYNGEAQLAASIDSILAQEGVDLEFIIVDDGSSDGTKDMIAAYAAKDDRIVPLFQANTGLTQALVNGCELARAPFIARQDCGDISHPTRLAKQFARLSAQQDAVMVSCATQFVAPGGEALQIVAFDDAQIANNLSNLDQHMHISHHGSAMFRKDAYDRVGGYRPAFRVAQDYDLWMRLFEQGRCLGLTQVLYTACLEPGSISSQKRGLQVATAKTIVKTALARRNGRSDEEIVAHWRDHGGDAALESSATLSKRKSDADWLYFIGCMTMRQDKQAAARYFAQAAARFPLHGKAILRFLQCRIASAKAVKDG